MPKLPGRLATKIPNGTQGKKGGGLTELFKKRKKRKGGKRVTRIEGSEKLQRFKWGQRTASTCRGTKSGVRGKQRSWVVPG